MTWWLIAFLVFAVLNIVFVVAVINLLSHPRFRDEDGDITTEVGFEEDSIGRVRREYRGQSQDEIDDPHMGMEKIMQ